MATAKTMMRSGISSSSSAFPCLFISPPRQKKTFPLSKQQPAPRRTVCWRFPTPASLAALFVLILRTSPQGLLGGDSSLLPPPADAAVLVARTPSSVAPPEGSPSSRLFRTRSISMEDRTTTLPSTSILFRLPLTLTTASSSPPTPSTPSSPLPLLSSLCSTIAITGASSTRSTTSPPSFLRVIGQGASGITYVLPSHAHSPNGNKSDKDEVAASGSSSSSSSSSSSNNDGGDWVVKVGRGPVAAHALRNEASLLRRLAMRGVTEGVEEVVGLVACDGGEGANGDPDASSSSTTSTTSTTTSSTSTSSTSTSGAKAKGTEETVVLAMRPYWSEAEQVDRVDGAAQVRALIRLLVGRVAVQGGVVLTDVQVLTSTAKGMKSDFMLIDLTEGRALEEGEDSAAATGNAALRAYVGEVATLIVPSVENHSAALQEAEGMGSLAVLEMVQSLFPLARGGEG